MIDKNTNYNKYFLELIQDVDESTILNPDLNGKNAPKLNKEELTIKIDEIKEFCKTNSISENVVFLASVALALNKFNFSNENLIYHGNNILFTTHFENREITIKDYLLKIQKDWNENSKNANFSTDSLIDEYGLKPDFYYSFNEDLDFNSFTRHKYNFYVNIKENSDGFILSAFYNDQLYSNKYSSRFLNSISTIINQCL